MGAALRVLFVEDSEDDAALLQRELRRGGYDVSAGRVDTAAAMRAALAAQPWDLVVSDFSMPAFNMPQALAIVHETGLDLPFIIVSGTIGEETAVAALKAGAHDFMTKDRLSRFLPAVERALREADERQARRQRERELEAIAALTTALRQAADRAAMLPAIVEQAQVALKGEGAALGLYLPEREVLVIEAARGTGAALSGQQFPASHPLLGPSLAAAEPRLAGPPAGETGAAAGAWCRANVVVPLRVNNAALGVLWVGRGAPLGLGEARLLSSVADIAASALHRAALYEQTERRLERLTALRTIDLAINASQDMRVILDVLLGQVLAQLRVDAAALLLANPLTQTLEFAAGRGLRDHGASRASIRFGEGLPGQAALTRRRLSVADLRQAGLEPGWAGRLAAEGFVAYHAVPLVAKGAVGGVLEIFHRQPLEAAADAEWLEFLETLAGQAAIAINNTALFEGLQRSHADLGHAYDATIEGWSRALDLRDRETEGHTQRVTDVALRLAERLGVSAGDLVHIRRGALLHDIGKMGIPDHILLKPGPLSADDWRIMRQHPVYAYQLLAPVAYLRQALDIPHYHHEKWDGSGYPYGLRGDQIPLHARLFAVADVWDALRSDRPYRPGWDVPRVRAYLAGQAGRHFDPAVVDAFWDLESGP